MPIKKTTTSTIPNKGIKHFFQLESSAPISAAILEISRAAFFADKIISVTKYKDQLVTRTEVIWDTRQSADDAADLLDAFFPDYIAQRDAHNQANGIIWTITYEEV